jgi:hypothetical protein
MAVAFVVGATGFANAGVGSLSFSIDCTGADLLLVAVAIVDGPLVTAITYNAGSMGAAYASASRVGAQILLYKLVAPATGSHTVAVTLNDIPAFTAIGAAFSGTNQATPLGTAATATGTDDAPTVSVTSAAGEIVIDFMQAANAPGFTVGAGQTQRNTVRDDAFVLREGDSTEAGAASVAMSWALGAAQPWATIGVGVKPAGSGGVSSSNFLNLLGVGR